MRRWALPTPDDPRWSTSPRYQLDAVPALRAACALAERSDAKEAELNQAFRWVAPLINEPLCPQQSIRVLYVAARVQQGEHECGRAIEKVNQALSIAHKERLIPEIIELLAFRGELKRHISRYVSAANDLQDSLRLLKSIEKHTGIDAIEQRFELLWQLATYTFAQGDFEGASQQVDEALELRPLVPHLTYEAASVLWVKAHIERTRGELDVARRLATEVAAQFENEALASVATRDRIARFVAEIALDRAERYADGPGAAHRDPFLLVARGYLRKAAALAEDSHDVSGAAQITLSRVRNSRLRGKNENRVGRIERVLRLADRIGDVALRAQALTALGDEHAYLGEVESALNCYREVLDALAGGEVGAYRVRPRRMLLRYNEHGRFEQPREG